MNYSDLIHKSYEFPQRGFHTKNQELYFHDVRLMDLIEEYGTPLRISYLPKISEQIQYATSLFHAAIQRHNYQADYRYFYCTKSSHFKFITEEVLKNDIGLETSSTYDLDILARLTADGKINTHIPVVCNGYKQKTYKRAICNLINEGFENMIPILDSTSEFRFYAENIRENFKVGLRMAADEKPNAEFYTSRLGIRADELINFYNETLKHSNAELKLMHFFINSGVRDTSFYWSELHRFVTKYCELRQHCHTLDTVDIGGGMPIQTRLDFSYDYEYIVDEIVKTIKYICEKHGVPVPNLITEFGTYTVGESGAMIYSVEDAKQQNDRESWYMIDGSLMTQLPDTWAKRHAFVLLAINGWNKDYRQVTIGGLTCDSDDFYNAKTHGANIYLPEYTEEEPLYLGFFHTGAYQDALGGCGGIQHCLVPEPQHIIVDKDQEGNISTELFCEEQDSAVMLQILGY